MNEGIRYASHFHVADTIARLRILFEDYLELGEG